MQPLPSVVNVHGAQAALAHLRLAHPLVAHSQWLELHCSGAAQALPSGFLPQLPVTRHDSGAAQLEASHTQLPDS
jgi:hypothetical protein